MNSILGNLQNQFQEAYYKIEEAGRSFQQSASDQLQQAQEYVAQSSQSFCQSCETTKEKTIEFVQRNQKTIFFIGASCVTAYLAPHLFFTAAIATIILRVEFDRRLREYMDTNFKAERNLYNLNPFYGPSYVSSVDLTMATIAALDAIALGTIFIAGSWTVALIPVLGGLAAGDCLAKRGIDFAYSNRVPSQPNMVFNHNPDLNQYAEVVL